MLSLARLLAIFASFALPAFASRSGLNNIPTGDVSGAGASVVQTYAAFGADRKSSLLTGVRFGFALRGEAFEAGIDSRWKPGPTTPLFFNAKWAAHRPDSHLKLGLGIAGLAPRAVDRRRLGQPQTYAVLTYDAGFARLHAGYAAQVRNRAVFFGVDRSWLVLARKLTFRSDVIQIQNRAQWLASGGFTWKLTNALGLELWQSFPTEHGKAYTTCKLGWYFAY